MPAAPHPVLAATLAIDCRRYSRPMGVRGCERGSGWGPGLYRSTQ